MDWEEEIIESSEIIDLGNLNLSEFSISNNNNKKNNNVQNGFLLNADEPMDEREGFNVPFTNTEAINLASQVSEASTSASTIEINNEELIDLKIIDRQARKKLKKERMRLLNLERKEQGLVKIRHRGKKYRDNAIIRRKLGLHMGPPTSSRTGGSRGGGYE